MGNEVSQEGGEEGAGAPQQPPRLVSQQSAPLPPPHEVGARRGSCTGRRASVGVPPLHEEPDLTNLTEEERQMIRSVMARAQSMEEEEPLLLKGAEEEEEEDTARKGPPEEEEEPSCGLCRSSARECACVECGARTCRKCSRAIPSGKKHVWMCVPCSEKYPGWKPNARGSEMENHSEIPLNSRRRISDSGVLPPSEQRQSIQDVPSARGRSDSLPGGQSSHQQKPQTRQEQPSRHLNGCTQFRGPRPNQTLVQPQQRPRSEQQRRPSREQRPQRPMESKQPQTGDTQRPQHPTDPRQPQMEDMQKPQHPTEPRQNLTGYIQRLQNAADPRHPQPEDMQRPQHPVDLKQSQPSGIQKTPQSMDLRHSQPGDLQRLQHPMDPRQSQLGDMQRLQHPMDPIHQPGDIQKLQYSMDPRRPQPGDLQRPQHPMDMKQHQPGDLHRLQHPMDPRQFQPGDIQRLQHPTDPRQQRPQHPLDPRKPHPSDVKRLQNRDDLSRSSQSNNNTSQLPKSTPRDARLQPPADLRSANNDPRRPDAVNYPCDLPVEQHPSQCVDPGRTESERGKQIPDKRVQSLEQTHKYTQETSQNQFTETNKRFALENDLEYAKTKAYHSNEAKKPKPQHPIVNPPFQNHDDIPLCAPQEPCDLPQQQQQRSAEKQLPPKRNQRLREPVDQQVVPRPQHPQEPFPCEQGKLQPKEETSCSTNPFLRSATNPFRRESLPEVAAHQNHERQRRGSLDESIHPDRNSKVTEASNKTCADKHSDQPLDKNCDESSNRDEEQRRNALNTGGVPVPRARTSLPPSEPYSEGRNGIPRTVPLTSLAQTLEQQVSDPTKKRVFADAPPNVAPRQQRRNEGWQDETEDEDDYFEMIEKAIARPQPRDIAEKSASEIQKQLMSRAGGHIRSISPSDCSGQVSAAVLRQIDASLQEKTNINDPEHTEDRGGPTEPLLLHEPPPVKHYLEEHKTQPVSYEAFSSAKALQNGSRKDETRSHPPAYYYSQTTTATGGGETTADTKQPPTSSSSDDWSPVSDLSPIADVSPSVEAAAEKELMEKSKEKTDGVPRATSGTISGMLEEFNRALGLPPGGTSPVDDSEIKSAVSPLAVSPVQKEYQPLQERSAAPKAAAPPLPTTPRRSHRRLPHPTVEQMQAAVAMAAQTPPPPPPPPSTTGAMLFGLDTAKPWRSPELQQSFEQAFNIQKQEAMPSPAPRKQNNNQLKNPESSQPNQEGAARRLRSCGGGGDPPEGGGYPSELPSPPQTPGTPRDKVAGDSSDTQSEAESVKSVRMRRKLPNLPATDQCSTPSPTRKNVDRSKNNGFGNFNGTSSPVPASVENSWLPSPPVVVSHLATPGGKTEVTSGGTPSPCGGGGSKLPEYMQSLKQQLRDELKAVTEERKAMLEQRGGSGQSPLSEDSRTTEDSVSSAVSKSLATYQAQQSALLKQLQAQSPHRSNPPSQTPAPVSQPNTTQSGVPVSLPYRSPGLNQSAQQSRTPLDSQPQIAYHSQLLQYQNQPQVIQYQTQPHTPYKAQMSYCGSGQELSAGQIVHESGRRTPHPATPSRAGSCRDLSVYQTMHDVGRMPMTPSRVGSSQDLSVYQTMHDVGRMPMTPSRGGSSQDFSVYQTMHDVGRMPVTPSRAGSSQDLSVYQTMHDVGRMLMTPSRAGSSQDLSVYQTMHDVGRMPMTPSRVGSSQDLSVYQTDSGRKPVTPSRAGQDFSAFQTTYDSGRRTPQPMTPSRAGSNQDLTMYQTIYGSGRRTPQPMTPSRVGNNQDISMYYQTMHDSGRRKSQPMTSSRSGSGQDLSVYQTIYDMGRRTPQPMTHSRAGSSQDLTTCQLYDFGRRTPQPMTPSRAGSSQDLSMYQTIYDMGRMTLQTMTPSRAVSNQDLYRCIPDSGGGPRTPLPDAVPRWTVGRPDNGDITVMTTATTTVVSASEWSGGGGRRPTATTMAPSVAAVISGGATVESLRRLQQPRTSPFPQQKKGRRRHTSEIAMPPFAQIEQAAAHYMQTTARPPPQYVQCYQMTPTPQPPAAVDFPSIESHARATDILLRSRHGGVSGTLLNTREQHEGGSDAYFQTLNSEINRLRRSSENLYRDTMYEKQWTPQDTHHTTDRRKRKEKKSRKPRSWHPSPYVSEDEDEQLTREEKKAKIKAEIARRRLQIEENMRLHDQLCRLSTEREEEAGRRVTPPPDDTSSVLQAIDEILRKDLYSGQKGYTTPAHRFGGGGWYDSKVVEVQQNGGGFHQETRGPDPESAMDESIAAIASTFPTTPPPDILLSSSATPAMPLLPDMPTRSRKLLENLGGSRSGSAQSLYQDESLTQRERSDDLGDSSSSLLRSSQRKQQQRSGGVSSSHKYEFPVKRILLTRDPKDRSVSGNGLGMRVVGGKEVPGSNGTLIGAYVAKIFPGGVVETLGEVKEGDQVLEWNGVPLTGRTYEEVQRIIASSADEVEIVIRCDLNMLEAIGGDRNPQQQRRSSPGMGGGRGGQQPPEAGGGGGSGSPPRGEQHPFGKRSSEGGGNMLIGNNHMIIHVPQNNMIRAASSYWQDTGLGEGVGSVFAPGPLSSSRDWPELYEHFSSSDDLLLQDEFFESRWRHESIVEQVQLRVCCGGPRAEPVVCVARSPSLKRALLDHRRCLLPDDYAGGKEYLLSPDLPPPTSLSRLSFYLSGLLREKAAKWEPREPRPRAPSDLPGLRPVFVNDCKNDSKIKDVESDDPNNNNTRSERATADSSPEAPYPKGCRGSFCVIL